MALEIIRWYLSPLCLVLLCSFVFYSDVVCKSTNYPKITGIRFLLTVNDTWDPKENKAHVNFLLGNSKDVQDDALFGRKYGCITTVATEMLQPNLPLNKSRNIIVGSCDHGPLEVQLQSPGQDNCKYSAFVTFHSSVIEDASPPTCTLSWNGTYLVPKSPWKPKQDLLPSCFVMDSREGYHMTYYWFHILEWRFEEIGSNIY